MKLGINARTFCEPEPGGAVQTAIRLANGLSEHNAFDSIFFGHESVAGRVSSPVTSDLYWSQSPFFGVIWERTVLPVLARRHEIDLLFCPNGNAPLHDTPYPVVTYVHDVSAQKDWSASVHGLYRKATIPRVTRVSDQLVTVSEFSKGELVSTLGVDPERVSVVYNGIDDRFFDDAPGDPVDTPDRFVLYVGAMNPRKNVSGLVEAYRRIRDDIEEELVLAGPRNKDIFESLAVEEADDIHMPGFVSQEELVYLYDEASVFVYPSFYEGFGLPPLEAMARGTPVVASDRTALPEVLGDAATYVDPSDASELARELESAITDAQNYRARVEAGRIRANRFRWSDSVTRLTEMISEVR